MTCPKTASKCATKHEFTPNQRQINIAKGPTSKNVIGLAKD